MTTLGKSQSTATAPAILVVGDPALGQRLAPGPAVDVIPVDDYLQALGEMSRRRVQGLVGRLEPMRHNLEPTLRAIRQLSPEATMLLVVDAADEPEAMRAVRLGVDDYLVEPLRSHDLRQALATLAEADAGLPVSMDLAEPDTNTAAAALRTEATSAPRADRDTEPAAPTAAPNDPALAAAPRADHADRAAPSHTFANLIEPTDRWIERVLSERGTVRDAVLEDMRRELGGDIAWAAEPALDAFACAPIMHGEQTFGYLVSDTVGDQPLSGAADRLARWLALEARLDELKHLANHDELTGVWNRRYFDRFLASVMRRAREQRFRVTLMLFDIDDFKHYNDEYGHAAGDEILREAARLMTSVVRRHDVVARVGGDEFAVIFWDADPPRKTRSQHPGSVRKAAERFQRAICDHRFPKLADLAQGTLTVSGGLASYPWDGQTPEALMQIADDMLLSSKRQGKNAITFGPGVIRLCDTDDADHWHDDDHHDPPPSQ